MVVTLATLFGFAGIVVATETMRPGTGHDEGTYYGIFAALLNALFYSMIAVMTRHARSENNFALTLWPDALVLPVALGMMFLSGSVELTQAGVMLAALSGVFGCAGFLMTNASLRIAPAAIVSPYHYTQIISGAIFGFLIWRSLPAPGVIIGAFMVVAAGLVIFRHSKTAVA